MCAIFKASAEFDIGTFILIILLVFIFIEMEYDWKMHSLHQEKNKCIQNALTGQRTKSFINENENKMNLPNKEGKNLIR